jgi:uncharacterized protein (TIGR03084 family)
VDPIVEALAAQHAELAGLLDGLEEAGWHAPSRCEGWDISDIVLHLAQTDEMAIGSVTGRFIEVVAELTEGLRSATSVDDGVALMVERERGARSNELFQRWGNDAFRLVAHFDGMDLSARVKWVAGDLSARTLATTRIAETWIHAGDVADALGVELATTDRLRLIARLAWRTLPYAFASTGGTLAGPVEFRLTSPAGDDWDFAPDEPAVTIIRGSAAELCELAARRTSPAATSLSGEGPDVAEVLALVRTYA